jgi:predicted phage tail protein
MVSIKLHGIFEEFVKTEWLLNVKTIGEVFEAIEANSNKMLTALGTMQEYLTHFIIYVDDKIMPPEYLNSPILKKNSKVEVVPLLLGSAFVFDDLLIYLLIMVIAMGISMLITRLMSPKSPKDIKNNSRLFSAYENVTKRNVAIPIGYGRLKIGSVVVSNDVNIKGIIDNPTGLGSLNGTFVGAGGVGRQLNP